MLYLSILIRLGRLGCLGRLDLGRADSSRTDNCDCRTDVVSLRLGLAPGDEDRLPRVPPKIRRGGALLPRAVAQWAGLKQGLGFGSLAG